MGRRGKLILGWLMLCLAGGGAIFLAWPSFDELYAKKVMLKDGNITLNIVSERETVGEAMRDNGIEVYPEDLVYPDMDQSLTNNLQIVIDRAKTVVLYNFLGEEFERRTRMETVGQFMHEIGYESKEEERIVPDYNTLLYDGIVVKMLLQREEIYEAETEIPFESEIVFDDNMLFNKKETVTPGQIGKRHEKYRLVYEGDKLVERALLEEKIMDEPTKEIIKIGRYIPPGQTFEIERGVASFYGKAFDGRRTASGEIFGKDGFTAAHPSLPFNTYVRVTALDSGKSTVVRITDRGPYSEGRVIDLTEAAFLELASLGQGVVEVKLEILGERDS